MLINTPISSWLNAKFFSDDVMECSSNGVSYSEIVDVYNLDVRNIESLVPKIKARIKLWRQTLSTPKKIKIVASPIANKVTGLTYPENSVTEIPLQKTSGDSGHQAALISQLAKSNKDVMDGFMSQFLTEGRDREYRAALLDTMRDKSLSKEEKELHVQEINKIFSK